MPFKSDSPVLGHPVYHRFVRFLCTVEKLIKTFEALQKFKFQKGAPGCFHFKKSIYVFSSFNKIEKLSSLKYAVNIYRLRPLIECSFLNILR
jgi:hypothetical protein